jgi:hypothetical protein
VPFEMVDVPDGDSGEQWASIDRRALSEALRSVASEGVREARRRGLVARAVMRRRFAIDAVAADVVARLAPLQCAPLTTAAAAAPSSFESAWRRASVPAFGRDFARAASTGPRLTKIAIND